MSNDVQGDDSGIKETDAAADKIPAVALDPDLLDDVDDDEEDEDEDEQEGDED